jgi:hypothetical protein
MYLTGILHYIDIVFHVAILVITEVLSSESKIKECRIRVDFVIIISFSVIFSKNLLIIIQGYRKRRLLVDNSCFTLFHII